MQALAGKNALITGGTTGIGRATAIALAQEGARIFTFGHDAQALAEGLEAIRTHNPTADGVTADATRVEDVDRVFDIFDETVGDLDLLVANAAVGGGGLADTPEDEWRYMLHANIEGYLACAKRAVARMRARGKGGRIVFIGSTSADERSKGSSVYVATKAAVQGFAQAFAKEVAGDGIVVSVVEPGTTGSDMHGAPSEVQQARIEAHKILMAEDIAEAVLWIVTRPLRANAATIRLIPRLEYEAAA